MERADFVKEFKRGIMSGDYDGDLEIFSDVIQMRKSIRGQLRVMELKVGDKIRVIDSVRPKIIAGKNGTVVDFKTKKIVAELDDMPPGRKRWLLNPMSIDIPE